jgi:Subtilase family
MYPIDQNNRPGWLRWLRWLRLPLRRPQPLPPLPPLPERLQYWMSYLNERTGEPVGRVGCYPPPARVRPADEVYFYRPGEVLVPRDRSDARDAATRALNRREIIVETSENLATVTVRWNPYAANAPTVPELLADIDASDRRLRDLITPNHVGFPAAGGTVYGAPWVNGGSGGAPQPVPLPPYQPTIINPAPATSPVKILVLDTGLINEDVDAFGVKLPMPGVVRSWLSQVSGSAEPQYKQGGADGLDLFDDHGKFIAGVLGCTAPNCPVEVVKVYDDDGSVDVTALADQICSALAPPQSARIVVISGGLHTANNTAPADLRDAIAAHPNVLFVAAAGNHDPATPGTREFYPAALGAQGLANVIGVGALDKNGVIAAFSNVAPSAQVYAHGQEVMNAFKPGTVFLPGNITQTIPRNTDGTALWSGTSFAAPVIAGLLTGYVATAGPINRADALSWLREYLKVRPSGGPAVQVP